MGGGVELLEIYQIASRMNLLITTPRCRMLVEKFPSWSRVKGNV